MDSKFLSSFIFLLLLSTLNVAQITESDLDWEESIPCYEFVPKIAMKYVKFYEQGALDSAEAALDTWVQGCGSSEPAFRAFFLLKLKQGNPDAITIPSEIIPILQSYQGRLIDTAHAGGSFFYQDQSAFDMYKHYYGYIEPNTRFDNFTRSQAISFSKDSSYSDDILVLLELYSLTFDTLFHHLNKTDFENTLPAYHYRREVRKRMDSPYMTASTSGGIWTPTGELKALGNHGAFSLDIGFKKRKMSYFMNLAFLYGRSNEPYSASREEWNDSIFSTTYFSGVQVGLQVCYDLLQLEHHELAPTLAFGISTITVAEGDEGLDLEPADAESPYIAPGLRYKFYPQMGKNWFIQTDAQYVISDLNRNGVISYQGSPVLFTAGIGFNLVSWGYDYDFRELEYQYRLPPKEPRK